jgi:hypothetical protein
LEVPIWQWEKEEEEEEEEFLYNKDAYNKINKGCQKTVQLCHTAKSKHLAK